MEIIGSRLSVAKLSKNFIPIGTTTKWANEIPPKKNNVEKNTPKKSGFPSVGRRAGLTNLQIKNNKNGTATPNPAATETFSLVINASKGVMNTNLSTGFVRKSIISPEKK